MPRFFALLVSILLFIAGVSFVLVQILRFLGVSRMSRRRREKERRTILDELRGSSMELSPWKHSEIDLLSAQIESRTRKKLFSKWLEGHMQTIYSEKVIPFASRIYSPRQFICGFITDKHEFSLIGLGHLTEVYHNDVKIGALQNDTLIRNGQKLGKIERNQGLYDQIIVDGKDLGHVRPGRTIKSGLPTERKMEVVMEAEFDKQNVHIFTALLGYYMLKPLIVEA